jgi:hypothetical protein
MEYWEACILFIFLTDVNIREPFLGAARNKKADLFNFLIKKLEN